MKSNSLKRFAFGLVSLVAAGASTANAADTKYPLDIKTCGSTISFKKAPDSMVTVGQSTTEIMYLLGLQDKIVGTSVWFTDVMPQFKDINAKIPRLADNDPSFESVIAKKPDLVATQFAWYVGPEGIVGTPAQFKDVGIQSYISPTDCSPTGDIRPQFSPELIYQEINELSAIFNVQDRGQKLIADLKARVESAKAKVSKISNKDLSAVFWFSSADLEMDPYVAGRGFAADYIMDTLGVTNVVKVEKKWPTVGWEEIAKADPDIIVVGKLQRNRFPADDYKVKMEFLKTDPVTTLMTAVKKDHLLPMEAHAMDPTIRTLYAVEEMADAIIAFGLDK